MSDMTLFFKPIVYDTEHKSMLMRFTEAVDDYFYYGGRRMHIIGKTAELKDDPMSTWQKCVRVFKLLSLVTIALPAIFFIAKVILNPRHKIHFLSEWFESSYGAKLDHAKLSKYKLTEQDLIDCKEALEPNAKRPCIMGPNKSYFIEPDDLLRLKNQKWLNEAIINTYFDKLSKESKKPLIIGSSYLMNQNAWPAGRRRPYSFFRTHEGKMPRSIFDTQHPILIPVNANANHWALLVVKPNTKTMHYYDSLSWQPGQEVEKIKQTLAEFAKFENRRSIRWKMVRETCPQQNNGSDCGLFCSMAAKSIIQATRFDYSADEMPYIRLKMLTELLKLSAP